MKGVALRPDDAPALAIIIPVFKHSMFVAEAIDSALSQKTNFKFRVVIINDGCPFAETHDTSAAFAHARPDEVRYIRSRNGGLSAARNLPAKSACPSRNFTSRRVYNF